MDEGVADGGFNEDGQRKIRRDVWIGETIEGRSSIGLPTERREMNRSIKATLFLIGFFIAMGLARRFFFYESPVGVVVLLVLWVIAGVGALLWMRREEE